MPMGPSLGGFAYFAGTKFLGYSAFAHWLRKEFDDPESGPARTFKIGGMRTLIGVGVGICYGLSISVIGATIRSESLGLAVFFVGLVPVRLGEWYLLLRLAFHDKVREYPQTRWALVWGTL